MYSGSPTLSQIPLRNSFGKVVFQILVKIEMTRNKNRLFGGHFETVQYFHFYLFIYLFIYFFFSRIVIFYNPYIYGANFIARFGWESGFLRLGP